MVDVETFLPPKLFLPGAFDIHVDTIMHMQFLGITKTLGRMLRHLLLLFGKYAEFQRQMDILKEYRRLYLDWWKIWPFGSLEKPFSPWVSENCVAFCRTMKTIYSVVADLIGRSDHPKKDECVDCVRMTVSAWIGVISRVMQSTYSDKLITDTERHIKIFLSSLDNLDRLTLEIQKEKNENSGKKKNEKKKGGLRVKENRIRKQSVTERKTRTKRM